MSVAAAAAAPAEEFPDGMRMVRIPVPPCEPPFDDELPDGLLAKLPGQLLLEMVVPRRRFIVVDPEKSAEPAASPATDEDEPRPTPRDALPQPGPWAARFARAFAEVLAANRPARQLVRWATWPVYEQLETVVGLFADGPRPVLLSVRVSEPADSVAEACAVVRVGPRCRALALRFEGLDGRWQCTAAQLA